MAKRATGPAVKKRPTRGREIQLAAATGLAAKLDRAAKSGVLATDTEPDEQPVGQPAFEPQRRPRPVYQPDIHEEEDEGSWQLPDPAPKDVEGALESSLTTAGVDDPDLDVLWDAIRQDTDRGEAFLGLRPTSSAEMRRRLEHFGDHFHLLVEDTLTGKQRAGFVGFQDLKNGYMNAHIYLLQAFRGEGRRLVRQLMEQAGDTYPGTKFCVGTKDPAMARMLRSIGFESRFLLTFDPAVTITAAPSADPEPPSTVDVEAKSSIDLSGSGDSFEASIGEKVVFEE